MQRRRLTLFALADAVVTSGLGRPGAGAGFFRPDEAGRAALLGGRTVDARAEQVALGRIRMGVDAVHARATFVHLLRLVCAVAVATSVIYFFKKMATSYP